MATEREKDLPKEFSLAQNYPNPFNPTTKIKFNLPKNSYTKLQVFDQLGRMIRTVINSDLNAGFHEVEFNGINLASGVYYYQIIADNFKQTKKLVLSK